MITSKEAKKKRIVGSLVLSTSCVQVLTMKSVGTLLSAFVMIIQGLLSKLFSTSLFWRQVTNNHISSWQLSFSHLFWNYSSSYFPLPLLLFQQKTLNIIVKRGNDKTENETFNFGLCTSHNFSFLHKTWVVKLKFQLKCEMIKIYLP